MIPHEHDYNSICQYIAAREPLYRQNVVQFWGRQNSVFAELVENGQVKPREDKETGEARLEACDSLLQTYFREARRAVDIKIFQAHIKHKHRD